MFLKVLLLAPAHVSVDDHDDDGLLDFLALVSFFLSGEDLSGRAFGRALSGEHIWRTLTNSCVGSCPNANLLSLL